MLTHIHIRNFVIVDELELTLGPGLCVLTGETGAGKSILIDALGLVLGDRADSGSIGGQADKAEISLIVTLDDAPEVSQWLDAHDLSAGDECLLRRVISRDERSRAYINGSPTSLSLVKTLGEMLVDIHGQHAHQSLVRRDAQRQLLDTQANHAQQTTRLAQLYREWQALRQRIESLSIEQESRQARLDWLHYQIAELAELGLSEQEIGELEAEHQRLANAETLGRRAESAYVDLYEGDHTSLYAELGRIHSSLQELQRLDPRLDELAQLLENAQMLLQEAASGLRHYRDSLELDPGRLEWVETRIASLYDLARKHRVTPEQLPAQLAALEGELAALQRPQSDLTQLQEQLTRTQGAYRRLGEEISNRRRSVAARLSRTATTAMHELGMPGGAFQVSVEPQDNAPPSPNGFDEIEYLVSTNPGQALKPLSKVASGGELSRISLALQVVAAHRPSIPTLVFDEVDSGIGGAVAETVGRQLRALGEHRQVLCVTHLPQVAAQAHHHYRVRKSQRGAVALTQIKPLTTTDRVEEIARMLGGVELTDRTRAHAQEMISRAQNL